MDEHRGQQEGGDVSSKALTLGIRVPEELLKDKTLPERCTIMRGYITQRRFEQNEIPVIQNAVWQKSNENTLRVAPKSYSVPPRGSGFTQSQPSLALHLWGTGRKGTAAAPLPVRLPPLLRKVLASRRNELTQPSGPSIPDEENDTKEPRQVGKAQKKSMDLRGDEVASNRTYFRLEDFDDTDFELHTPEEWVALGQAQGGTPARSRYFVKVTNETEWRACRVVGYDDSTCCYRIVWECDGRSKWTTRLNIIFNEESEERWLERVRQAEAYRRETESALRGRMYLEQLDSDAFAPMSQEQIERILRLVAHRFPLTSLPLIEQCSRELEELYSYSLKRASHWREVMSNPEEQRRAQLLGLPSPPEEVILPVDGVQICELRGTIDTPSPNYHVARDFIAENLFQTHPLLYKTIHSIHTQWNEYRGQLLCFTQYSGNDTPLDLRLFYEMQSCHGLGIGEKLRHEWSMNVRYTILNNLDLYFKFYEEDIERYNGSRTNRFVNMVNIMMTSQLRGLLVASLQDFAAFIHRYRVIQLEDDEEMDELEKDIEEARHWERRQQEWQDEQRAAAEAELDRRRARSESVAPSPTLMERDLKSERDSEDSDLPFVWRLGTFHNQIPYTKRVVEMTMQPRGFQPLFVLNLVEQDGHVVLSPSIDEVRERVMNVFNSCFDHADRIQGMGEQLFPLLQLQPFFLKPLDVQEPVVREAREMIQKVLDDNVEAPMQLLQMYQMFEYILQLQPEEIVEEAETLQISLHDFDWTFERFSRDRERIVGRTSDYVRYEMFFIDCREIKTTLITKVTSIQSALMESLAKRLWGSCTTVLDEYDAMSNRMAVEPRSPEELQELREFLDAIPGRQERINKTFETITAGFDLLFKYKYEFPTEACYDYHRAYDWPRRMQQELEDGNFRSREYRNLLMQALRDNCETLTNNIVELGNIVDDFSHFGDDAHADRYYEQAKSLEQRIKEHQEQIQLYNSHEVLFGLPQSKWPQLKEIKTQFEPYYVLWEVVSLFQNESERWLNTRLHALQPVEADRQLTDWAKKAAVIAKKIKEAEPAGVVKRIRENIAAFRPNIPLLYALRSNLQASHWKAIYQACGVPKEKQSLGTGGADSNDWRPFSDFIKLGMLDYMPQIESIATVAQKSYELESELMAMETEWKKLLFDMEPYQDTHKLKANDIMQLTLDEHILKTQSMLGKPIVRQAPALQARVSQWEKLLDKIQCTMDEWFKCQSTWAYLEPIFSSADISRSLPKEKQLFVVVDESWHKIMEQTRITPQILTRCQDEMLLRTLTESNSNLDIILKKLQQFLETKRMAFPRFYFISNEELLQILSDSKDPYLVQPYLSKCFEGIKRIHFADAHDILAMESSEGEVVPLIKAINPSDYQNRVELWLQGLETTMKDTILDQLRQATGDYATRKKRTEFIRAWPGQVVIAICSLYWTMEATERMRAEGTVGLTSYHEKCVSQLDDLIVLVRDRNLAVVERCTLEALVVVEVHAKDIIAQLSEKGVDSPKSFDWLAQLRYYWEGDHLFVHQINASLRYGYEYLGNTGRLVITPLTDRCYRTLIGALHLNYGGAPEGPAGTGKTETTKDLAKALGKYCVVYNCSDQITAKDMAKLFKGLSQSGSWGCFDEFNRIEIQVLSVIAQQVAVIQEAIIQKRTEFIFDGAQIRLDPGCAVFITMNPGYAGRAELPDNLKALFRPVAMMVPNYAMIGEIQLYSYGFLYGKELAEKIVATYRLCSEQLSSQDHYDYGMRAVKAVLTAAGRLKRTYPDEDEMVVMLRSIQDVNLPKFLTQDVELFKGIISDLFPGVELPEPDYMDMHTALERVCATRNLQLTDYFELKIRQTYEMIVVRHGMMLVGFSFGGKTKILQCLSEALGLMEAIGKERRTRLFTMNPKSVTMPQLYGKVEPSGEWTDGILPYRFRLAAQDTSTDRKWLVLDGPVDAVWIENMNTVLDDNKKLCLQNGDIIAMSKEMNLIFEVQDLAHASPATVSRCGMVYVEPDSLGWRCLIDSYFNTLPEQLRADTSVMNSLSTLVNVFMHPMLEVARKEVKTVIPQGALVAVSQFIKLFSTLVASLTATEEGAAATAAAGGLDSTTQARNLLMKIEGWFLFSLVWSVGGCLFTKDRAVFSNALHSVISSAATDGSYKFTLPIMENRRSFFDVRLETEGDIRFAQWADYVSELVIEEGTEYQDVIVPTSDQTRYSYLTRLMIGSMHPILLVGDTGTGKTMMMKALLKSLPEDVYSLNMLQFSAQTSAGHLQRLIDACLEKRRKGVYGPPINKKMLIFVDDTNLPQLEEYGAQPPIELLRQFLDHGGWYNHTKDGIDFRRLVDMLLLCAMGPAGGGRSEVTQRFTRHLNSIAVPAFDEPTLRKIFTTLSEWILSKGFAPSLRGLASALVSATVELYETLVDKLKPSPEKSHYTFNLRDVSKVFQGIDMVNPAKVVDERKLALLWVHEVSRAFADRFTEDRDTMWFLEEVRKLSARHLKLSFDNLHDPDNPTLFSTFMNEDGYYEEVTDVAEARRVLESKVEAYNLATSHGELDLVIFNYVLLHVSRICRVLRQPGGHLLLIGVGGSGRRSCVKFAAFLQECDYMTITPTKDYDHSNFLDDIRSLLLRAGMNGYSTVFVMTDTQITTENFLEDLCSLLNTSEIPGIWDTKQDKEVYENAVASLREIGKELGRPDSAEALQALFTERCRKYMHIALCFSPIGSTLRDRLRKFPSLVNCTTIDWFRDWPEDGLRSVASRFLSRVDLTTQERAAVEEMFVSYQKQVRELGQVYFEEMRQYTYVTPTSYLDLLSTFARLLGEKRAELTAMMHRYANGLTQLKKTEDQVEVMQQELALMRPQLANKQLETDELIKQVEQESKAAEEQRALVAVDEAAANEQAAAAKEIKDASQKKVDEAQPLVEQAQRAVLDLDPKALQEIKALKTPPQGVKYVIEVLCTLLGGQYKPKPVRDPISGSVVVPYWEHAKVTLLTGEFKNILLTAYPVIVDTAPKEQIEEVVKKMTSDMFKNENIKKTSVALLGVATYIRAVVEYYKQNKIIKPLLAQAAAAQQEYDLAMESLNKKKEELRVVNEKLASLTSHLDSVKKDKQDLEEKVSDTDVKLTRAKKLIEGLGGEKVRFAGESKRFEEELKYVLGNVVVSAGVVAYLGPFLHRYRERALQTWLGMCRKHNVLFSEDYALAKFVGSPIDIQAWKLQQLPSDGFSIDNAVIVKTSDRWPLFVDPQQQANNWIRNMERANGLIITRPADPDCMKTIRGAIAQGRPVLLESVEETLDPTLENLLLKRLTREGTVMAIHVGEPVEWNKNFRFYMTTKLPRPHYLPEVSTKVTLINFMITQQGLQDQLLQRVMMSERREVEEKKQALTLEAAENQANLKRTEDKILAILSSEGNILESETAIEELDSSKVQSDQIAKRQTEIEAMERISDRTRNLFISVANLGAILFFCVTELANIDPMYQHSLSAYVSIFQEALQHSEASEDVEIRNKNIRTTFQMSLYQRICRSLFARDQLLFSFIMCLKIHEVNPTLLRWLLTGGFEADEGLTANPFSSWLPDQCWKLIWRASTQLPEFASFPKLVREHEDFFRQYYEAPDPLALTQPAPIEELRDVLQLIIVRCFRTDKVVPAVTEYVREKLGNYFVEPSLYTLEGVVNELSHDPSVPLVLVLSPGADPSVELDRLAEQRNMSSRLFKLSLGQGQGVFARQLIEEGIRSGHWVFLQNCHLYQDFMPELSRIIENYSDVAAKANLNDQYRLWLTSLPSDTFPISILQSGVKLVQEPPKGLKSNLLQSYLSDPVADKQFFNSSSKPEAFRKMLFGLCFFHAVVQERRQFGPLGWNRMYEFNDTDRRISVRQLHMFLEENDEVPYDALLYLTGQCNYGGRVTDDWDRRCIMAILSIYLNPLILEDDYLFSSETPDYYAPSFGEYNTYVEYIQSLPLQQPPGVFGLHENADITKDERDARNLLEATLMTQPRDSSDSASKLDPKTTVRDMAQHVFSRLPVPFDIEEIQKRHPITYSQSMNTVLLQETIRYKRLLLVIRRTLTDVQDAISGKVVMSAELEEVFNAMYDGKVPDIWKKRSYPSLKPFGSYVNDLIERLAFLNKWCDEGPPAMFWISGFYFTQSFLTGVMQNYARKWKIAIDKLTWQFAVVEEAVKTAPEDGCFIYGLFLEGAGWDSVNEVLCESRPKELFIKFPILRLLPCRPQDIPDAPLYRCPCYKTTDRRGVLSTTGHSTNFILTIDLPRSTSDTESHWVLRGAALFTQLPF
ncbi:putative Dynein heavy chain N terminal region 2 domain1 [Trypanosoma vivax]|uniref:Putative dynein heavy chain n=1 Tax=Trypanosoma vivax (strain Y486) TaxID=1055687 RepID=G0TS46_TRYVY|nr:putative dynein heavy chain [Trypanosoma vivax]KAH8615925.1 putative Dynein heavy chain N terminal region 2 domain1 [Trypanosoma vivax]CCC46770.1 putative dynein heavy chain [Trypanosoma vivax Y486]